MSRYQRPDPEPPWDELDEGIREVVRALWTAGFRTTSSCQGGEGHHWPYSFIAIRGDRGRIVEDAIEIKRVLADHLNLHDVLRDGTPCMIERFTVSFVFGDEEGLRADKLVVELHRTGRTKDGREWSSYTITNKQPRFWERGANNG